MGASSRMLGLGSGVGLVVANMVGAGVFLSAGFMAQELGPGEILLVWVAGAVLALSGSVAYAAVAVRVPRSGGEYRYLSDLVHPALGSLAGWASLLLGFSAPIAVDAVAAGAFLATFVPALPPRATGAVLIVLLTAAHAAGLRPSKWTQNLLVVIKAALLLGFVAVGLAWGRGEWPAWSPPQPATDWAPFARGLFFVAFAFSGWNAAAYAAEEFRRPERDVPRSMLLGCGLVAVLYLLVNWVLVANLTRDSAAAVLSYEAGRLTLGHLVLRDLVGEPGARAMSALIVVALVSSMSAMTFAGPRVYAAMAADGMLPRRLAGRAGQPPAASVVLQGLLALALVAAHEAAEIMLNLGALLTLFAGLTAASLFAVWLRRKDLAVPSPWSLAAAALYASSAAGMLWLGLRDRAGLLVWVAAVALAALAGWRLRLSVR